MDVDSVDIVDDDEGLDKTIIYDDTLHSYF